MVPVYIIIIIIIKNKREHSLVPYTTRRGVGGAESLKISTLSPAQHEFNLTRSRRTYLYYVHTCIRRVH